MGRGEMYINKITSWLKPKYTGTSKKIEYLEKGQYFVSFISESETHILYRFITHRLKYQIFLLKNEISISIKLVSRRKHEVL